jgi:hypothetical protein
MFHFKTNHRKSSYAMTLIICLLTEKPFPTGLRRDLSICGSERKRGVAKFSILTSSRPINEAGPFS